MFISKTLKIICLIIFLNVTSATPDLEECDFICEESDQKPVCALDKNQICFLVLPSKCYMDLMNCLFQTNYAIYIDDYCKLEPFKCIDLPLDQSPTTERDLIEYHENSLHILEGE